MKKLSKLLALLLVLAMMFSLAACASKDKADTDTETNAPATTEAEKTTPDTTPTVPVPAAPTVVGVWNYEMNISEAMGKIMEAALGTDELAPDAKLVMKITLDFDDNGKLEMTVDVDEDEFAKYVEALCDNMMDYLYAVWEAQGVSKEQADAQIYQQYGMTTEEYVDAVMDESMAQALGQFPMVNTMCYKLDEEAGMIYTAKTEAGLEEKKEALEYKLEGEKLTIINVMEDGKATENPLAVYGLDLPWVFEKQ